MNQLTNLLLIRNPKSAFRNFVDSLRRFSVRLRTSFCTSRKKRKRVSGGRLPGKQRARGLEAKIMSTNESTTSGGAAKGVAQGAPTEQQAAKSAAPKRFEKGQTVCNEKDAKGKLHNGHLKQVSPIREEARKHMRGDDLLYRCQTCGTLYMGPPLGHVRDPGKQARYVQSELVQILEAAGGTLPAFKRNETGAWVPASDPKPHAPAPVAAAAQNIKPAVTAKPAASPAAATPAATASAAPSDETPEQKRARIIAEAKAKAAARMAGGGAVAAGSATPAASPAPDATGAPPEGETAEEKRARMMAEVKAKAAARMAAKNNPGGAPVGGGETSIATPPTTPQPPSPTSGTDSSASADAHRPAAEAQAATGQASAAPMSPAAATASPVAGAETVADLAPDASTELTPGAPRDERHGEEGTTTE
jgi:hypothetical protein